MTLMNRRQIVAATGAALAGWAGGLSWAKEIPADDAPRRQIYKACKWGMILGATDSLARFQWCKELGYNGMEPVSPLNEELVKVQEASRLTGLPVHGVVNKRVNRQFQVSSPDEKTRDKGRKLLEQSLRESYECGGDSVLLLPGKVGGAKQTHDDVWGRSIPQIRAVLPVASKLGVRILIENVWNGFCQSPEEMRDYIDEIDSPWVGSYFDIGNACRFAPSEKWIRVLGRRIVKLDVKDWSESKGLCDIGDGEVNWPAVREALAEIHFNGWATAEVRGGGRERLADIARRMDRVLDIR
jgi:L-ribulose-5-phosphate 3-epimerase